MVILFCLTHTALTGVFYDIFSSTMHGLQNKCTFSTILFRMNSIIVHYQAAYVKSMTSAVPALACKIHAGD